MDLKESARRWVVENLPYDRNDADVVSALTNMSVFDLLVAYANWSTRLVEPIPRRIFKSSFFGRNVHSSTYADALSVIEGDIRAGKDLTPFLSRDIRVGFTLPGKKRRRPDLDLLLNDWGVHHLHLSTELEADGFVKRTGPLLFARFTEDAAYFLDIAGHREWTKSSFADALVNEFHDIGGAFVLEGTHGTTKGVTAEEHQVIRDSHVNAARIIGDKVVIGEGINLRGHAFQLVPQTDHLIALLERFETRWREDEAGLRDELETKGVELPDTPNFEFAITELGPVVVETATRTGLQLMLR